VYRQWGEEGKKKKKKEKGEGKGLVLDRFVLED
jgi:hypothetical protein